MSTIESTNNTSSKNISKRIISKDEKVNRIMYGGLLRNNKTTMNISLGLCYLSAGTEVFKILYSQDLVQTLVSTIGTSFFVGTIFYFHKTSPANLIKFIPRSSFNDYEYKESNIDESDDESDTEEDEEELEFDVDVEQQLASSIKKPTFNYSKFYGFIGYGMIGGFVGNVIATSGLYFKYGSKVAKEWNTDFYLEIFTYICGTTLQNTVLYGIVDIIMKSKWFVNDKIKLLGIIPSKKQIKIIN